MSLNDDRFSGHSDPKLAKKRISERLKRIEADNQPVQSSSSNFQSSSNSKKSNFDEASLLDEMTQDLFSKAEIPKSLSSGSEIENFEIQSAEIEHSNSEWQHAQSNTIMNERATYYPQPNPKSEPSGPANQLDNNEGWTKHKKVINEWVKPKTELVTPDVGDTELSRVPYKTKESNNMQYEETVSTTRGRRIIHRTVQPQKAVTWSGESGLADGVVEGGRVSTGDMSIKVADGLKQRIYKMSDLKQTRPKMMPRYIQPEVFKNVNGETITRTRSRPVATSQRQKTSKKSRRRSPKPKKSTVPKRKRKKSVNTKGIKPLF